MSREARDWAWAVPGLDPPRRLVLLALAEFADSSGARCFPGQTRLCTMTGLCVRAVRITLHELVRRGHVLLIEPHSGARPAVYRLPLNPALGAAPASHAAPAQDAPSSGMARPSIRHGATILPASHAADPGEPSLTSEGAPPVDNSTGAPQTRNGNGLDVHSTAGLNGATMYPLDLEPPPGLSVPLTPERKRALLGDLKAKLAAPLPTGATSPTGTAHRAPPRQQWDSAAALAELERRRHQRPGPSTSPPAHTAEPVAISARAAPGDGSESGGDDGTNGANGHGST